MEVAFEFQIKKTGKTFQVFAPSEKSARLRLLRRRNLWRLSWADCDTAVIINNPEQALAEIAAKKEALGNTDSLVEILKRETASLREQYLQQTREWAVRNHAFATERIAYYHANGRDLYATARTTYYELQKKVRGAWAQVTIHTVDNYVAKEVESAEIHYNQSIEKLAYRIREKGLDESKLQVLTSHVGVNIETTLTDGTKKVRAFTVLAWGPIVRPHYRYLIK